MALPDRRPKEEQGQPQGEGAREAGRGGQGSGHKPHPRLAAGVGEQVHFAKVIGRRQELPVVGAAHGIDIGAIRTLRPDPCQGRKSRAEAERPESQNPPGQRGHHPDFASSQEKFFACYGLSGLPCAAPFRRRPALPAQEAKLRPCPPPDPTPARLYSPKTPKPNTQVAEAQSTLRTISALVICLQVEGIPGGKRQQPRQAGFGGGCGELAWNGLPHPTHTHRGRARWRACSQGPEGRGPLLSDPESPTHSTESHNLQNW